MLRIEIPKVSLDSLDNVTKFLERMSHTEQLSNAATQILLEGIQERFKKRETASGESWVESEASKKRARGIPTRGSDGNFYTSGPTLLVSGKLYESITRKVDGPLSGAVYTDYYVAEPLQQKNNWQFLDYSQEDLDKIVVEIPKIIISGVKRKVHRGLTSVFGRRG